MLKAKNEKTEAALIDLKARLQKMEEIVNRKNWLLKQPGRSVRKESLAGSMFKQPDAKYAKNP